LDALPRRDKLLDQSSRDLGAILPESAGKTLMKRSSIAVGILAVIPFVGVLAIGFLVASYWKPVIKPRAMGGPRAIVEVETNQQRRGFIGIDYGPLDVGVLAKTGFESGVLVKRVVPGSPGAESGMEVGDYLVEVDGTGVGSTEELRSVCLNWRPDQVVELTIVRQTEDEFVEKKINCRLINFDGMQKLASPSSARQ
jgi:S1-C subfamily serine protease